MTIVVLLLIAAIAFGGIGLLVKAAAWAFVVALALLVAGAVTGYLALRGSDRHGVTR